MACNDIPSLLDLQKVKKHADDFGRLMGTGEGDSTNEVTGQVRPTYNKVIGGMNNEFNTMIGGMNNEFNTMIVDMNSEFDAQILNMGFTRIGTFSAGATITNPRQTLLWDIADGGDGQEYGWSGTFPPSGKVVPPGSTPLTTGGIAVGAWMSRFDPALRVQVREALRRSYAEAGYNLVDGSFEAGGVLVNAHDVLLQERTGKAFSGPAGTVAAGTNPASGGFVDKSGGLLRHELSSNYSILSNPAIVTPEMYSDLVTSGDWTDALNAALSVESDTITLVLKKDFEYNCNGIVEASGKNIQITGNNATLSFSNTGGFRITGEISEDGVLLDSDVDTAGGNKVTLASGSHEFSAGDTVIIWNPTDASFGNRAYYRDGEFNKVLRVNGTDLYMALPLRSKYLVADSVTVHKMDGVIVDIKNLSINSDNETSNIAAQLYACKNFKLRNVHVRGGKLAALSINKCFSGTIRNCSAICDAEIPPAPLTLQYGVVVFNSQQIHFYKSKFYGTRHGSATGGDASGVTPPCRDLKYYSCSASSLTLNSWDSHENADNILWQDCTGTNGITIGGKNLRVRGGDYRRFDGLDPLQTSSFLGGDLEFSDLKVSCNTTQAYKYNDSAKVQFTIEDANYIFKNITVYDSPNITKLALIGFASTKGVRINIEVDTIRHTNSKDFTSCIETVQLARGDLLEVGQPETVSIRNVNQLTSLTDFCKALNWSSVDNTYFSLPSQSFRVTASIASGEYNGGIEAVRYVRYPIVPTASSNYVGNMYSNSVGVLSHIQSVTQNTVNVRLATVNKTDTVASPFSGVITGLVTCDNLKN